MRLGRVLHHAQSALARELEQRIHVGGLAVEVHGHDRARAVGDERARGGRVERERVALDVGEHGHGARVHDRLDRREERVRGRDHLVARADAAREQRREQRVGAVRDAEAVSRAAVGGELLLERHGVGPVEQLHPVEDRLELAEHLLLHRGEGGAQIDERDVHGCSPA